MADSPSNLIAELLGETFVDAVERSQDRTIERLRWLWRWLADIGEPPHGARLVTHDGTVHTGLAVIERNRIVLLIGFRHSSRDVNQGRYQAPPYHDDPRQQWLDEEWPPGHYPSGLHYSPVR